MAVIVVRYQLYYLRNGILAGNDEIEAADDGQAAILVDERDRPETVEIWRDGHRVQSILPKGKQRVARALP